MLLIRHQKERESPFNVLSLDSEDSDGITYIWCVSGHYQGKEINREFTDRKDVVEFLFHRRWIRTFLVGVNLDYDLNTLKYRGGFNWHCIYNMGKLITAYPEKDEAKRCGLGRSEIKIIELGNWILNTSLKKMCEDFGIVGHIDKHVLGRDGTKAEMIEACMSHARAAVDVFDYLQNQLHAIDGRIKLTSSASALDCFMLNFLSPDHQIYDFKGDYPSRFGLPKGDYTKEELEQARVKTVKHVKDIGGLCYVGGRCENFRLGLVNRVTGIDIVSSYPNQMRNRRAYPDMNTYRRVIPSVSSLLKLIEVNEGAAFVKIKSPDLKIPFLHHKSGGKLLFPNGTFSGWYTIPELRTALKHGYEILECYEAALFDAVSGFFDSYIDTLFKLKDQKETKKAAKLLLNGLSGKFGQKVPDNAGFVIVDVLPEGAEIDDKNYFLFGDMIYKYVQRDKDQAVEYVNTSYPLISAYITAYGRIQLWEAMNTIGFDNVYYCDTDSIHGDHTAIKGAVDSGLIEIDKHKLGAWSYDYQNGVIDIRGLKYYRTYSHEYHKDGVGWHYYMKGVPSSLHSKYWLSRGIWVGRTIKIKTAIRGGKRVNKFVSIYRRDQDPAPKRFFEGKKSEAYTIFD
jgi:hypothetical protein